MSRKHRVKARTKRLKHRRKERNTVEPYFSKIDPSNNRVECRTLISKFKEKGCAVCPENDPCCLDAHHRCPEEKRFNIGEAVRLRLSPEVLKKELAKCACICANCHRKFNAGRLVLTQEQKSSSSNCACPKRSANELDG